MSSALEITIPVQKRKALLPCESGRSEWGKASHWGKLRGAAQLGFLYGEERLSCRSSEQRPCRAGAEQRRRGGGGA